MTADHADAARAVLLEQCAEWVGEAGKLRVVKPPGPQAPPAAVHAALVETRAALDQLEVILGKASALKATAAIKARALENAAEDAWDDKANAERRTGRPEYQGAQERYAYWRVATRAERREARLARDFYDTVAEVEAAIRLAYRGLDGSRQDLLARLRYLAWESAMER